MIRRIIFLSILLSLGAAAQQQDTVIVRFRYTPPTAQTAVYLVGEFNGWNNSSWPMISIGNNTFIRDVRLLTGGQPGGGVPGAYQYKFYYSGVSTWPSDPLNPRSNPNDNDNSILYVKNPTIYQLIPNQVTGLVGDDHPVISAYVFPKVHGSLDTSSLAVKVDTSTYAHIGTAYDTLSSKLTFRLPNGLKNGSHTLWLWAGTNIDSVTFTVQAGALQITNLGNFVTRNPLRTIYGTVADTSIHSVLIVRNGVDTFRVDFAGGKYSKALSLKEGVNIFQAVVKDTVHPFLTSDSVSFTYLVNHTPFASARVVSAGSSTLTLSAASTVDPDGQTITNFEWLDDPRTPLGLTGKTGVGQTIVRPTQPGEYFFAVVVTDSSGNKDTTRNFFRIEPDGSVTAGDNATVVDWVRKGRIYSLFFNSFTSQQTIKAATARLPYIQSLGFNILWLLPVMENASPINNGPGPGYNIMDFYNVARQYGTNQDFKNFVQSAHQLGMKVILDVTPNHTSYAHPFASNAKLFRENSPYWSFYVHTDPFGNTNGLGSSLTDGFQHYDGWDQLLNYNWNDVDARAYMIGVYRWWIQQFDVDGYRFDVYWGPHNRANSGSGGETEMGMPVRQALRHVKPDIFLLGETAGTGAGTEVNYADQGGGVDAGYDWNLKGVVQGNFTFDANGVNTLDNSITNGHYFPGPNSTFLRFLENQDEDRIAYKVGSYAKTMPLATALFTAPGLPMIWQGEEVGMGLGIADYDQRRRGFIDWSGPGKALLTPHYQKLAEIRAQFPAFSTHDFARIASGNGLVYTFVRKYHGEEGIVATNFSAAPIVDTFAVSSSALAGPIVDGKSYIVSDLYNDTSFTVTFNGGVAPLVVTLPPYGSSVMVLGDSVRHLVLPQITGVNDEGKIASVPSSFSLSPNFPNPFNPSTTLEYTVPRAAVVSIRVYSLLGKEIATLFEGARSPGLYSARWDGRTSDGIVAATGVYFVRMQSESFVQTQKVVLMK